MKKIYRNLIFLIVTIIYFSILCFIYIFSERVSNFTFANMMLEFYILTIAYLFLVLMIFEKDINKKKQLVMYIVISYFIQFTSLVITTVCNSFGSYTTLSMVFTLIGHVSEYFVAAFFVNYLLYFLEVERYSFIFYIYYAAVSLIAILFSFTGLYFSIDADGIIHRGGLYSLSYIFSFVPSVVMICLVLFSSKIETKKKFLLASFQFVPVLGDILNVWFLKINYEPVFASIALLLLYFTIALEKSKNIENQETIIAEQKKELEEGEISILLSSIQPHFLYNSLSSIMNLCTEDPQEAQDAIADFADYLRLNLDSLKERKLISFEKELEHTEIYLKLQKLRFKEKLNVVYNINVKDFYIPAITLQPLVENACKHGIFKKQEGGTIIIETNEVDGFYEIKVIDDGVGFNQIVDDGRTHTGIKNVKNRISILVNGVVDVTSKVGQGTIAKIYIPMEVKNENSRS